ncbi:hypothetical protein [Klebsiella pneumoniae IS39]|nr:hypothetical protein [Klebsiella pneumoniae IS39]
MAIKWRCIFYRHFSDHIKKPARGGHFMNFFRAIAGVDHQLSDEAGPGLSFLA